MLGERTKQTEDLMIILNHCNEISRLIHSVLQIEPLSPIVYTERLRAVSKYCETVLHSIKHYVSYVGHSGCHKEKNLFSKGYSLKSEAESKHKSLMYFFSQPVKAVVNSVIKLRIECSFCTGKHGFLIAKKPAAMELALPRTLLVRINHRREIKIGAR